MTFSTETPVRSLSFRPGAARLRDVSAILVSRARFVVLIALPALYFVTASKFVDSRGPFWQGSLYDPNYQYLLSSLLLLEGETPGHIDHPGTPVQIVGAALLATKNTFFDRSKDLAKAVIKNPEKYLEFLSSSLRWLFAISLLLAPLWIFIRTSSFSTAIAFQIAPLLNSMTFVQGGVYFKPESLINTLILWFCAWVVTDLIRQNRKSAPGVWTVETTLAAIAAGACVATKMHTAPLLLIALAAVPSVKRALLFGAVTAVSFLACTIPIFSALPETLDFAFQMATHTERYGHGKPGIIDPNLFWRALRELLSQNWIVFVFAGLCAGYHAVRLALRSENANARLHLAGLFLAGIQVGFLILVAKHPAHHYLLPLVVSLSLSLALVTYTLNEMKMHWAGVAGLAVPSLAALGLVLSNVATRATSADASQKANVAFYETVSHKYDRILRADFYSCSSPEFALLFGDRYCRSYFSRLIHKRFPKLFYFNVFNSRFYTNEEVLTPEEMMRTHPVVYLHGATRWIDPCKKDFPEGTRFTTLEYSAAGRAITEVWAKPQVASGSPNAP